MIEKFTNIWANSGETGTAPSDTKQDVGFVRREKPIRQMFNWLFNGIQQKINLLISDGGSRQYDETIDPYENISKQFYGDEAWGLFDSVPNAFGIGGSSSVRDIRAYVDAEGNSMILALDELGEQIRKVNPRTGDITSSGDLTTNLAAAVGSWQIQSFVTDGTYIYVLFFDNGAGNAKRIQSFQVSNWIENSSWPSTGRSVTAGDSETPNNCMCWATPDVIAIACAWNTCTSASSVCIYTFNASDGSLDDTGAGDCNTGESYAPNGSICSDGDFLYFAVVDTGASSAYVLCSADISNLKTGCGGTGFPHAEDYEMRVCSIGKAFVFAQNYSAPGSTAEILTIGNSSNVYLDRIVAGKDYLPNDNENIIYSSVKDIIFDGINVWLLSSVNNQSSNQGVLLKLDVGKFSLEPRASISFSRTLYDVCGSAFMLTSDTYYCMAFDGRDIFLTNNLSSANIRRLPLAAAR